MICKEMKEMDRAKKLMEEAAQLYAEQGTFIPLTRFYLELNAAIRLFKLHLEMQFLHTQY